MDWMKKELVNVISEQNETYSDSTKKYRDLLKVLMKPKNRMSLNSDTPRDFTEDKLKG